MEKCAGRFNCIVGPTKYRCVFVEYAALFPRNVSNASVIGTPAFTPMEIGCAAILAAAYARRRAVVVFVIALLEHVCYQAFHQRILKPHATYPWHPSGRAKVPQRAALRNLPAFRRMPRPESPAAAEAVESFRVNSAADASPRGELPRLRDYRLPEG